MATLLRRLRVAVFVAAILGSIWLLGAALVLLLATDLTAPNLPGLALDVGLALYPSLVWWKSRRNEPRWAVVVSDVLAGILQLGSAALWFLCVRAAFRGGPATNPTGYGVPLLASMFTAWIAVATFVAVSSMQAHAYVSRRWPIGRRASDASAELA